MRQPESWANLMNLRWCRSNGQLLWQYQVGNYIEATPAVANGVVYFGSYDHNIYALNASTGALLWQYTASNDFFSSPAVVNGMLYDAAYDGNLYAFHLPGH